MRKADGVVFLMINLPPNSLGYADPLFLSCGLKYGKEVYYRIAAARANPEIIERCINSSDAIRHYLCLLSKIELNCLDNNSLDLQNIENICRNTNVIIIGAYDGEGYLFWERR